MEAIIKTHIPPEKKKDLLVSYSGGETSAYMAQWLWKNMQDQYNMVFVFANTGLESPDTITFLYQTALYFGFHERFFMIEAQFDTPRGSPPKYKKVTHMDYDSDGVVFEKMCEKYGLPNVKFLHCTRELKERPIRQFGRDFFGHKEHITAIGIREDEIDRMSVRRKENRIIYPLISTRPMTKKKINFFWSQQPFRLTVASYEGNCRLCHKKSDPKLFTLIKEIPSEVYIMSRIEWRGQMVNAKTDEHGRVVPNTMYRQGRTILDMELAAKQWSGHVSDQSEEYEESCEIFATCGIDN